MGKDYHGLKPVTSTDKKMAKEHLDRTEELLEDKHDLLVDKIKDHAKAMEDAADSGNKKSYNYNKGHKTGHVGEDKDVQKERAKINTSKNTLGKLKTYDDVRKAKVNIMRQKAGV